MSTPLEENVDILIGQFNDWFQQAGNEPLTPAEKAIVKTFCWFLAQEGVEKNVPDLVLVFKLRG